MSIKQIIFNRFPHVVIQLLVFLESHTVLIYISTTKSTKITKILY